jgi:hypothetical protein
MGPSDTGVWVSRLLFAQWSFKYSDYVAMHHKNKRLISRSRCCRTPLRSEWIWRSLPNHRPQNVRPTIMSKRDRKIPQRFTWILPSSGMLRSAGWFRTDVSGLRIGPIFKGQYVQILFSFLDILTLEDGTDTKSGNVDAKQTYAAYNIPEDGRIQLWVACRSGRTPFVTKTKNDFTLIKKPLD